MQNASSLPLWVVFLINKIYIVTPKHRRRQLTAKMCGSKSATFNIFFRPFLIFFLCSEHFVQQPQLKKGSAQNGCLQQYRVLRPLSVFIAPNSFWLKTFTAQSGYCLLHRMPFLILCACAHSLIPRPKTTVTGLGMRLVHTENSAPTMAGRVYSCGSGKAYGHHVEYL